ncbi:hypothetical protein C8R43DRAFT_1133589 [Mycena crocata]|nr:hypothetical protein C8R43DRAFT_1133589 [Mycena crocata]
MSRPTSVDVTEALCTLRYQGTSLFDAVLYHVESPKPFLVKVAKKVTNGFEIGMDCDMWLESGQPAFPLDYNSMVMTISQHGGEVSPTTMTAFFVDQDSPNSYSANVAVRELLGHAGLVWKGNLLVVGGGVDHGFRAVDLSEMSIARDVVNWRVPFVHSILDG